MTMRLALLAVAVPLLFSGCISLSSSPSQPAPNTTVVVPQGSTAVCADGTAPPCP